MAQLIVSDLCHEFLNYMYSEDLEKFNLNAAQYCNERNVHDQIRSAISNRKNIIEKYPEKSFLNIGVGPGFLEWACKKFNINNLDSVELQPELQKQMLLTYNWILDYLDVQDRISYRCNDIRKDDFEIFGCNKTYDFILCFRFTKIGLNRDGITGVKEVISRLSRYGKKLIINSSTNKPEIDKFLRDISDEILEDEFIVVDLQKFNLYK